MKVIIMAGGYAKRMGNLYLKPKHLLEIDSKPIIQYITEQLKNYEIIISTNSFFEKDFKEWVEKINENYKIVVEESNSEENKLGTIAAINYVIEKEGISDDCIVIAGDNIFGFDLNNFIESYKKNNITTVAVFDVESLDMAKNYGVVKIEDDFITDFKEKPETPESTLISTACYGFPSSALKMIPKYLNDGNNKDSPGNFISWLSKNTKVKVFKFNGYWFDVGTEESLKKAREFMKNL